VKSFVKGVVCPVKIGPLFFTGHKLRPPGIAREATVVDFLHGPSLRVSLRVCSNFNATEMKFAEIKQNVLKRKEHAVAFISFQFVSFYIICFQFRSVDLYALLVNFLSFLFIFFPFLFLSFPCFFPAFIPLNRTPCLCLWICGKL